MTQKIREEIERRYKEYCLTEIRAWEEKDKGNALFYQGQKMLCVELLSFLSTLESEKPMQEGLEEEIHKYNKERFDEYFPEQDGDFISEVDFMTCLGRVARHFAQWQKEQMISALKNDGDLPIEFIDKFHEIDRTAFQNGQANMKKQMLKEAVEGRVFMSFAPGHHQMVMADVDLPTNTKVRVIILPKEDEK